MSKRVYYKIDCEESRQLQLSGADKDVYFFVKAFREGVTMGQSKIAELLCMRREQACYVLQRLCERGLIERTVGEVYNGGIKYNYKVSTPCAKSTQGCVRNPHRGVCENHTGVCAKIAQGS